MIEEYRRFLFLGQVAGHPVTPSDEVDQAWHLHLAYTRSYWDDLCGSVLGRPFHHGPTRGGQAEGAKFEDWYERTKASYRHWFGQEPPADIWPPSSVRFGHAPHFVRVNTRQSWVVTKPRHAGRRSALAAGTTLALAGCSGVGALSLLGQAGNADEGGISILGIVVLVPIVAIVLLVLRSIWSGAGTGGARSRRGDGTSAAWWAAGCDGGRGDGDSGGCSGGDSGCGGGGCGGCGAG